MPSHLLYEICLNLCLAFVATASEMNASTSLHIVLRNLGVSPVLLDWVKALNQVLAGPFIANHIAVMQWWLHVSPMGCWVLTDLRKLHSHHMNISRSSSPPYIGVVVAATVRGIAWVPVAGICPSTLGDMAFLMPLYIHR